MKPIFQFPALVLSAALLLGLALPASAQPKPAKAEAKPKAAASNDVWERKLSEVIFDNLPLAEVVNFLTEQFPEVNFVVHSAVKDIPVTLKLRSVTLEDIFTAIDINTKGAPSVIDPSTGLPTPDDTMQINKLNDRMVSFTRGQSTAAAQAKPVCRAFSLNRFLAGKSDKDVITALSEVEDALKLAWKMLQSADQSSTRLPTPQLSLHRATKLLIVVGQPEQVEVVDQVIVQLEGGAAPEGGYPGAEGGRFYNRGGSGGAGGPNSGGIPAGAPGLSPSIPKAGRP